MKNLFPGYYKPSDEEFHQMWQECIFAFDANMLLNIYRYTSETQESFFMILDRLKDRIWIPHQAAIEFYKNREAVIEGQIKLYEEVNKLIDDAYKNLEKQLIVHKKHVSINFETILESIMNGIKSAKELLESNKKNHPDYSISDALRDKIAELFDGKVGSNFDNKRLSEVYEKAEQRYAVYKPPGFADSKKPIPDKYNDVVIWFQLIEFAKTQGKPIIFVTDDRKDDWWLKKNGKTVAPQPELTNEIQKEAKVDFYMYHSEQFIKYASEFLKITDKESAIQEVEDIGKQDEEIQNEIDFYVSQSPIHFSQSPIHRNLIEQMQRTSIPTELQRTLNDLRKISVPTELQRTLNDLQKVSVPTEFQRALNDLQKVSIPRELQKSLSDLQGVSIPTELQKTLGYLEKVSVPRHLQESIDTISHWRRHPLSGRSIPQDIDINITPKYSVELKDNEGIRIEVCLNELGNNDENLKADEIRDEIENINGNEGLQPYEFNNFPQSIMLTYRPDSPHSVQTFHKLRKPTFEEWKEWSLNLECSRRYHTPVEIEKYNLQHANEEKVTEIWSPFYSELEANESFYNKLIQEIAGFAIDENDDLPRDEFREVTPEIIENLPFEFKNKVITKLYKCWCELEKTGSMKETERKISQYISEDFLNIIHTLRSPTEDEINDFRTNIISGNFSFDDEKREVIKLKLNLSIIEEFYQKLILNIENATVNGKSFSDKTKDSFLEGMNPVYKLRVLEPLFNINAWYFAIDDTIFP